MKILKKQTRSHMVDVLFTLALFCVFTASALIVVLIGANVYKSTVDHTSQNYNMRASITYVFTKIKQNDAAGAVAVETLGESDALVLSQYINDEEFQTWIYHYDGALREVFTRQGNDIHPADGQVIMELEEFLIEEIGDGLYRLTTLDSEGEQVELTVSTRC